MFTVLLRGLEFYAYHGVPPEEQVIGHRYRLDLELQIEGSADETDEINDTIDYASVAEHAIAVALTRRYKTMEKVARLVGDGLLDRYPPIRSATVTLTKRLPPAPIIAEEAGVKISVTRD